MRASRVTVLLVGLLASCGDRSTPATPPAVTPPEAARAPALPKGVPDAPVGHQLAWVLAALNDGGKVTGAEIEAHFHPTFLAEVPTAKAVGVFAQLAELAPITVKDVTPGPREGTLAARIVGAEDARFRVTIALDGKTGLIEGLRFQPDGDDGPRPTTWDEAMKAVPGLGERAQLLVASVDRGTCKTLYAARPTDELAIGSTLKLYVLLGLVDQIAAGKATWETPLAIRDDWKSLPSGTMQDQAAGTIFPLRKYADQMISISDNTATDHLLFTVGRRAVEAAVRASKHAQPNLVVPFMSTRELFLIKLAMSADEVTRFKALGPEQRRAELDGPLAKRAVTVDGADDWKNPRHVDTLEWFASSDDLCRVLATLGERARTKPKTAPLLDVLSINPGLPVDKAAFPYVGFKGGSEPGVMNLSWLLRRKDDRWFVVTLGVNDTRKPLEEGKVLGLATGVLDLLAKEP